MFRHACAMGLEGIVSKRVDSRHKSGRCLSWVKVKNLAYERR
jgi:bifunctional non-homologous end joining protein LigD